MNIGEKIKELRKNLGISPEKLGAYSDVTGAHIRKIEGGQIKDPRMSMVSKIAQGLGVRISDLLDNDDLPNYEYQPLSAAIRELAKRVEDLEKSNGRKLEE